MSEKSRMGHNEAAESFIRNIQHEARIDERESPREHALRLLSEVQEILSADILQSREEAIALLAKLDVAEETTNDHAIQAAAQVFRSDIKSRYGDLGEK